jgi:hypothetical protein
MTSRGERRIAPACQPWCVLISVKAMATNHAAWSSVPGAAKTPKK